MAGFLTAAASLIGGNVIADSIVRMVIAYGVSRLINGNTAKNNDPGAPARQDQGVRLQIAPNTANSIPILFGSAFYGGIITDAQLTNQNKTMWYCITLSDTFGIKTDNTSATTRFTNVYWNNQRVVFKADGVTVDYVVNDDGVVDASPRDLVRVYLYRNGSATPTAITDPETNNPIHGSFSGVDARTLMPSWTNDHAMSNLAFALVRVDYNRDKGVTGLPDMQFNVRNDLIRPGDAIYSYLRNARVGCDLPEASIDVASLTALNDYADDDVSYLDADGTFKTLADRYQVNGVLSTADNVLDNLEKLCLASGCYLNYDIAAGKWGVVINRDAEPTLHFNDSNIISGITVTGTALDGIYNGVEVQFPHRQIRDQADYVRIDLPNEYRNANEPDNTLKLSIDMINEPLQARELAYIELYQNRMDQVVTFTTDYSKINTEAGDIITITNSVYDWTQKEFRVIRVKEVESEEGGIAVEITAQEYDATMYTAGGTPRRPGVPSLPIGIPSLGAIATPAAPAVLETNNQNALPNIVLRSVVPGSTQAGVSVIVDRMEFWYAEGTIAGAVPIANYQLIEVSSNADGNPFTTGTNQDSQPIVTLTAGTYVFRVRAGNPAGYSAYSDPTQLVWDPVQRTDEVDENTQFTPDDPDLLDILGPLAMGAALYFAYQALKPELLATLSNTELGKLLGIQNPADVEAAKAAIEQQASGFRIINAGAASLSAIGDSTVTFIAGEGIEITAVDVGHEITISATGGASANKFTKFAAEEQDTVEATEPEDTLTILAGEGLQILTNAADKTITIQFETPEPPPPPPPPPPDAPGEATLNVSFGTPDNDFVMDSCRLVRTRPNKFKRAAGTYPLERIYATGGSTEFLSCYNATLPVIVAGWIDPDGTYTGPIHKNATYNYNHPFPGGFFNLISSNPALNGKVIKFRRIGPARIIAYCDFDDAGNTLPVVDSCDTAPDSRPVFSTVEFPAGHRSVSYAMLQGWITAVEGKGLPISSQEYLTVPEDEYYAPYSEVYRRNRICKAPELSYDFNT
jgi:hypothetical protein